MRAWIDGLADALMVFAFTCFVFGLWLISTADAHADSPPELFAYKVSSGLILSDDFNNGQINSQMWERMNHPEFEPTQREGWLRIEGQPSGNVTGPVHAGAMTRPEYYNDLPNSESLVLAASYRIPNWPSECIHYTKSAYYELHLCNVHPDLNHSIRIQPTCQNNTGEPKFAGLTFNELPLSAIRTTGAEMFIAYHDGQAQGYIIDGAGAVRDVGAPFEVDLSDNKRIELKAPLVSTEWDLDLQVDYALLYQNPKASPLEIKTGITATHVRVTIGDWHNTALIVGSTASIYLPERQLYPVEAQVEIFYEESHQGSTVLRQESKTIGVFPGDAWVVTDAPIPGC